MRSYEIVYVLDATLDQDAVAEKLGGFHELLDGEVEALDHWGVRRLAYPIAKARMAYYAVAHVQASPAALPEFERRLKLDAHVLRYLMVLNEGQPASGDSIFAEAPPDPAAAADEEGASPAEDGETEAAADATAEPDEAAAEEDAADVADEAAAEGDEAAAEGEAAAATGEEAEVAEAVAEDAEAAGTGEHGQDEWQGPAAGPPEFSGSRGRGRRHDAPRILLLNYKDVATLSHFVSEQGKILPKRTTKVTARFQRRLGAAVKRARYLALMPYVRDHGS